jgi:hypothetical protein
MTNEVENVFLRQWPNVGPFHNETEIKIDQTGFNLFSQNNPFVGK